ncbi:MAG: CCA tRNA nucleotidyltransferase [Phycisphaerae bacterium]|nr:CCA tRNA nucleotidyltransferase [Phycisphaerae bacterium]
MAQRSTKPVALWVVRRLRAAGFQALLAGGCVRDMLLGVRSTDYDVATDATPPQVRKLFPHVLLVGAKFGVAMVIHRRQKVEVSAFRSDVSYSDGRRPDAVTFTTAAQDARRRDFTINGLFYDPIAQRTIDYVGGREDLRKGLIRTIGPARQRFAEDYLRMIRAVRFAVRFDFAIAPATGSAIRRLAPRIRRISGERIFDELGKMLARPSAGRALEALHRYGLAREVLPELFDREGVWDRAQAAVAAVAGEKDIVLALAALLGGLGPETIAAMLRRWGASNELRAALCWMAGRMDLWPQAAEMELADFKRLLASPHFLRLRLLWQHLERAATGRSACAARVARRARSIPAGRIAPRPLLTGSDLKALGFAQGPHLGRVLRAVHEAQLTERISTRRQAVVMVRRMQSQ